MPPDLVRRFRLRITLRQIGVLVVFVAITLAVMRPTGQSLQEPLALRAGVELPYVLILPTLLLVRRGPLKSWIVAALCCVPLMAFLVYLNLTAMTGIAGSGLSIHDVSGGAYVILAIADGLLLAGLCYLGRWVIPRFCPECGRQALLRDPSVPRSRLFPGPSQSRSCVACGSRFRRRWGESWVDVDTLAPASPPRPRTKRRSPASTTENPPR